MVEHHLAKVGAAGSNPVSRFFYLQRKLIYLYKLPLFLCANLTQPDFCYCSHGYYPARCFHALLRENPEFCSAKLRFLQFLCIA